ncbi:hypothetical protein BDU57DRAFT_141671 [Ampelomyces quisqualis]|uniref:Mid2 domain-containing protein n=1 Tax=Ampelomyces quisqualis TaxID=50730 RepID=A0A6A5QUR0_AMPQU|nr:hypothetical protein BDU57DRAFT_141671 [Ampelomyces quisqualis]
MCNKKPGKVYNFPKDQEIYAATRISLSSTPAAQASSSASPSSSSKPASSSDSNSGLSKGALAGIVLGALVGIALILGGILLLFRRKKNKSKAAELSSQTHGNTAYGHAGYQYSAVEKTQSNAQGGHADSSTRH